MKIFASILAFLAVVSFFAVQPAPKAHANVPQPLYGQKTASPGAIATAAQAVVTVAVVGALVGDTCDASYSGTLGGVGLTCQVTATDTAVVNLINVTGGSVTPTASSIVRVQVLPQAH